VKPKRDYTKMAGLSQVIELVRESA
jgi:hypothetical protein